jgi:hypothetical protein
MTLDASSRRNVSRRVDLPPVIVREASRGVTGSVAIEYKPEVRNDAWPSEELPCADGDASKSSTTLRAPSGQPGPSSGNLLIVT